MTQIKNDPVLGHWPVEDIEAVTCCPICSGTRRLTLHAGVEDGVFHCAPGRWDLHSCAGCGAAYLDPRPTPASIGRAYASYYTHAGANGTDATPIGRIGKLRRALRNGYLNHSYGASFQPASALGWLAMQAMRGKKTQLDREYRHLPRFQGKGEKVLDIGCGDGAFLKRAAQIGWEAWGVEPDAKAAASLSGFKVLQGSLPNIPLPDASFDYITLSHVIEHLHDPVAALKEIHRLLKPGGQVWIATPNIESLAHRLFSTNWIAIQLPTHLVLFNRRAMLKGLASAGFQRVHFMAMHAQAKAYFSMSQCLKEGRNPFTEYAKVALGLRIAAVFADMAAKAIWPLREELVLTAEKSAAADSTPAG